MDKTDKIKWRLENAKEMNKKHPKTFEIPSSAEIKELKIGHHAKVIFIPKEEVKEKFGERMWIIITDIWEDGTYIGNLNNEPITVPELKHGDRVMFRSEHITSTLIPKEQSQENENTFNLKEAKEYELYFLIDQCGALLWKLQRDLADSNIEITPGDRNRIEKDLVTIVEQQKEAVNIVAEKIDIELIYQEITDAEGNKTAKIIGDYWKWFNHWKEWVNSFSCDEWEVVRQKMESKESIDEYLPKNNWKH